MFRSLKRFVNVPERKVICVEYKSFDFRSMNHGVERRKAIIDHILQSSNGLCVNRKYCLQIDEDSDLKYLLKKGILTRDRWGFRGTKNTYLILK